MPDLRGADGAKPGGSDHGECVLQEVQFLRGDHELRSLPPVRRGVFEFVTAERQSAPFPVTQGRYCPPSGCISISPNEPPPIEALGSPRKLIYPRIGNSDMNHPFGGVPVDFLSQGWDHVDRVDGVGEGDDSLGGAKADGIQAAAVSSGNGHPVLSRKCASSGTRLWLGTGGGQHGVERASYGDSLRRGLFESRPAQDGTAAAGSGGEDSPAGRTEKPSRSEVSNAAGLYPDHRQSGSPAVAGRRGGDRAARPGRAYGA
jgi:hypothetical protein